MRPTIGTPATLLGALACALASSAPQGEAAASKHYFPPATPENVQWGWYDRTEKPRLVIKRARSA